MMKSLHLTLALLLSLVFSNVTYSQHHIDWSPEPYEQISQKASPENAWMRVADPALTILYASTEKNTLSTLTKRSGYVLNRSGEKVAVFIKSDTPDIQIPGFTPQTTSPDGTIISGWLELTSIKQAASHQNVLKIEASKRSKLLNLNARNYIRADVAHEGGGGLPQAYTGKDVIVGVLDSGVDFDSPDFSDENGTRIQYLLELTADGGHNEWTKEEIDNNPENVSQIDGFGGGGHGTHVTGSAAGNGSMNSDYTGIAPESDIIFVKGVRDPNSDGGFGDNDVIFGVQRIFEYADSVGKPAVVNLSLGGNLGPLDGSSLYEQFLTDLQGEGKIIVAAAGNEGFDFIHTGVNMEPNTAYFTFDAPMDDENYAKNVWYDKGAISAYKVFALDPETFNMVDETDWLPIGTSGENPITFTDSQNSTVAGYMIHSSTNTEDTQNGDGEIQLQIDDGQSFDKNDLASINQYYWGVVYAASDNGGRFDAANYNAWGLSDDFTMEDAIFVPADRSRSVGSPATAKKVISVGAFVSQNSWVNDDGVSLSTSYPTDFEGSSTYTPEIGQAAYFSSRGPSRDGRIMPTISAPGDKIFSVRSQDISDSDLEADVLIENGQYMGMQGTSMASPMTTGVIALMLEANPNLDYEAVVDVMSRTAVKDSFTGDQQNTVFGYGKIDAVAALSDVIATSAELSQQPTQTRLHQNYPNPFNPATNISFTLGQATDVSLSVYNIIGQRVSTTDFGRLQSGLHSHRFDASNLSGGMYIYQLKTGKNVLSGKMTLIK